MNSLLSKISFDQIKDFKGMIFLRNDMNTFSCRRFEFHAINVNIDMGLKMFSVGRFVMEHQFIVVKKYIICVVEVIIVFFVINDIYLNANSLF